MHDPRVGRFFAVDPLMHSFPWNSPYAFSENDVIASLELEGLEKISYTYTLTVNTIYEKKIPNWIPFSHLKNYSASVSDDGVISDIRIESDVKKSFIIKIKIPSRALLSGNHYVGRSYDTFTYQSDNLEGLDNPENWKKETNYSKTFEEAVFDGFLIGSGDALVEALSIKIIGSLTGVARLAKNNPRLASQILQAETTVRNLANKIAKSNPNLIKAIEKQILGKNGKLMTDFDIETDKYIIEVTRDSGKGKSNQILNKIVPNSNGKEVIIYGKGLRKHAKLELEKNGIKVFDNAKDLIEYINK